VPRSDWALNGNVGPPFWDGDIVLWHNVKGNMVQPDDPRFAWAAFYRRTTIPPVPPSTTPTPAGFAQVIVIACRNRVEDLYDLRMDAAPAAVVNPYPVPKLVQAQFNFNNNPDQPDEVLFSSSTGAQAAIAPGTFVVIANDTTSTPPGPNPPPPANGWVVRIGNQVVNASGTPIADRWELLPGNDFKNIPAGNTSLPQFYKPTQADVYIVGQAFDASKNAYVGGTQDVSVYTTFIQLK
jgi:hypothetical protein